MQEVQVTYFKADRAYRTRAAKGLGLNIEKIAASIDSMVAAD
ncbi:MAG: hypothetical protein WA830_07075 [Candidatus Sulfotelmatobacter sp.]